MLPRGEVRRALLWSSLTPPTLAHPCLLTCESKRQTAYFAARELIDRATRSLPLLHAHSNSPASSAHRSLMLKCGGRTSSALTSSVGRTCGCIFCATRSRTLWCVPFSHRKNLVTPSPMHTAAAAAASSLTLLTTQHAPPPPRPPPSPAPLSARRPKSKTSAMHVTRLH